MKYTKEERLDIGRQIHESGLSDLKASKLFDICEESARRYRILYEQSEGIEHIHLQTGKPMPSPKVPPILTEKITEDMIPDYHSMSKEELIEELMKAKIREARLKKGYMVKGDGAEKEYILLDNKNTR